MADTHLLLYTYVPDMLDRRGPFREAHLGAIKHHQDAGHIVMAGATGDPPSGGAVAWQGVSREDIEAFVSADPYHVNGLITEYRIEPWTLV